jgi:hypothetical protein
MDGWKGGRMRMRGWMRRKHGQGWHTLKLEAWNGGGGRQKRHPGQSTMMEMHNLIMIWGGGVVGATFASSKLIQ